jgi:hypothetical protein
VPGECPQEYNESAEPDSMVARIIARGEISVISMIPSVAASGH